MKRLLHVHCLIAGMILVGIAHGDDWPQFRGPQRDNISRATGLLREWPADGPRKLWSTPACEGYAGAAIRAGRVYIQDYDRDNNEWVLRCLQLADGKELWRFAEKKRIRPNHGITRTVPAVDDKYVFALDPKCMFHCLDANTGTALWQKHLPRDYGAQIPPWYNGQCPLIEPDRVVIGVGGPDDLIVAFDKATGNELWKTPNEHDWPLSHSSLMPAEIAGVKQYLWCTLFGPLGVRASDGKLLWHHDRKFNVAVAPSPLPIGDDRVFMTSCYEAGSIMLRVIKDNDAFKTDVIFDWTGNEWNAEVHTPILYKDHMFAVGKKRRGLLTCLDLDGKIVWDSAGKASFGLGSFLLADGMIFILEGKTGMLRLVEASTTEYKELASAQVLHGHDVWAPMALAAGKLVVRDMQEVVCLDVRGDGNSDEATKRRSDEGAAHAEASPRRTPGACSVRPPRLTNNPSGAGTRISEFCILNSAFTEEPSPNPSQECKEEDAAAHYALARTIDSRGDADHQFTEQITGITVDRAHRLYIAGDQKIVILARDGQPKKTWPTDRPPLCVAVHPDGRVFVGEPGQIEIFAADGEHRDTWRDADHLGYVTSIGFSGDHVIVGEVIDACLRRFAADGTHEADFATPHPKRGFMLPNRHVDLAIATDGTIWTADPGRHRVLHVTKTNERLSRFGHFDTRNPAGFTGCCNPTNLALTPTGEIVTTEKAPPRAKLYNKDGELLSVIATDVFDPNCKNMDIAVDARGHIYVVDTERLRVLVFAPVDAAPTTPPTELPA